MFIPLHDANALKHIRLQYVTLGLIIANVLVFLGINVALPADSVQALAVSLGYIPAVVHDIEELPPELLLIAEELSFVTYAFLHADWMHLGSNMLFLWVFGDNVEDALGHFRFLVFYCACAAFAALAHGLMDTSSIAPLIGASGAVAGIIAAYLILHPKVRVWVLVLGRIPLPLPAFIPLLFWIVWQIYMLVTFPEDQVSWAAHVGGFVAGAVLVLVLKRRSVPLFDREIKTPEAVVLEPPPLPGAKQDASRARPWGR